RQFTSLVPLALPLAGTSGLFDLDRDRQRLVVAAIVGAAHGRCAEVAVGWAKRSVPTIKYEIVEAWWTRRDAPLPTLRHNRQRFPLTFHPNTDSRTASRDADTPLP